MPGVVVTTAVRTGPSAANVGPAATLFVVGQTERGPSDQALRVTSIADFESKYGGYVMYGYVHPTVQTFFEEGGSVAYISRVVGASASPGTLTLLDSSSSDSITLTAVGAGDWSTRLSVAVVTSGSGVLVRLFLDDVLVYQASESTTAAQIVNKINSSSLAGRFVTATDEGGSIPAVIAATPLSAGNDDRGSVTSGSYVSGLENFLDTYGAGAIAIPGQTGSGVWDGMIAHANANHRIAICSFAEDETPLGAVAAAADYADFSNSEHAGFFYPWVTVQREAGAFVNIPPDGYVAGKRALAHNTVGAWQTYAGLISEGSFVRGISTAISKSVGDTLDQGRVNAIRLINNRVRIYGARSASSDEDNFRFLNSQEMLNYVVVEAQRVLEDLVFSTIDGRQALFSRVKARLVGVLEPIRVAGGFFEAFNEFGERIDYGYTVTVDESINPVSQLAGGLVRAKIGMRVSSVADQIEVEVVKSNLTASV
jgi:hypothetical protein